MAGIIFNTYFGGVPLSVAAWYFLGGIIASDCKIRLKYSNEEEWGNKFLW